jgi:hypothetical protein
MGRMLASCQPDELVEFIQFLGLVVHRLQVSMYRAFSRFPRLTLSQARGI